MLKQKGFTLIELMVVMAIIAILATAGLSAFGGYLKKARDTKRIADMRAIESVVVSTLGMTGSSPTLIQLRTALSDMNNGNILKDPLWNGTVSNTCLTQLGAATQPCKYIYYPCDQFVGYQIEAYFESASNLTKYDTTSESYLIGKCSTPDAGGGDI